MGDILFLFNYRENLFWWSMFYNDSVDFISQKDKVSKSNSCLQMPLGMRNDGIAPLFSGVHIHSVLEAWITVAEGCQRSCKVIVEWQEECSQLK